MFHPCVLVPLIGEGLSKNGAARWFQRIEWMPAYGILTPATVAVAVAAEIMAFQAMAAID